MVLEAAVQLLVERGFSATTIEAISARSGVAKTTIYRHWPDKDAVLRSAVASIGPAATAPDTGSLRGDLTAFLEQLTDILSARPTSALVPSLIEAAERDTAIEELLAEFTATRRRPLHDAVARAKQRGELDQAVDPEELAEALLGPLFYRRLLSRRPIAGQAWARLVDTVLANPAITRPVERKPAN
jgi:AcrR family transcriptional regulator